MKKNFIVFLLLMFGLTCFSYLSAQTIEYDENVTVEQLQEEIRIQRQELRKVAKEFLVDALPSVIELNPAQANAELQEFSSTLSLLGDNDVLYLLGHMYARAGENDRAISIFDSLLKTDLNYGARKMLNIVLYRKLTELLQAGERQTARDYLSAIVFDNYNTEQYFPAYLYLYSDLGTDSKHFDDVSNLIMRYNGNREIVLNALLPLKQNVLNRLNSLDIDTFYQSPSKAALKDLSGQIDQIKLDITAIYNEIIGMEGILFLDTIIENYDIEMSGLDELKHLMTDYANASIGSEEFLIPAMKYIEASKQSLAFYDRVLKQFDLVLSQNFLKLSTEATSDTEVYTGDLYLDRIFQIQMIITSYDEIIKEIDELLASGEFPESHDRLMMERNEAMRSKAEAEVLHQKYVSDVHNLDAQEGEALLEILDEYYALLAEKKQLDDTATDYENYVLSLSNTMYDEDFRNSIRPMIASQISDVALSTQRDAVYNEGWDETLTAMDFITLQMSYRSLMAVYQKYLEAQIYLTEEEQEEHKAYWRSEQLKLIGEINTFLANNPDFSSIDQPGGNQLVGTADLYYYLAELQYYAIPEDLNPALVSYRKALELDPNLPNRDLALYNIAFITSELKRMEVSNNKITFRNTAGFDDVAPANSLYSEANFSEALAALQEIVRDFPDSKVYEESVYRLGLLNFSFSTDSDNPELYRDRAIGYFDQIVANSKSPLYYDALYQRGWVRLNSFAEQDLRMAMNDFMELLKASESGLITDKQLAADYCSDAVDNIAYCLIALDGTDFSSLSRGIAELQRVFDGYSNEQIVQKVLDRSTQLKLNMNASLQAIDFLQFRIDTAPMALINPVLQDSILFLYHNSGQNLREGEDLDQITQNIYQKIINNYSHDSQWYSQNKDKDISRQMSIVDNAYTQRGFRLYNNFVNSINRENLTAYENHLRVYKEFAQLHNPDYEADSASSDSLIVTAYSVLADRTQDIHDINSAIKKLYDYNDKHPQNSQFYENEELAMIYARNAYATTMDLMASNEYTVEEGAPANEDEAFAVLKNCADRYLKVSNQDRFKTPERMTNALDVILLLGDIQFGREKYPDAIALYQQALEYEDLTTDSDKRDTYLKLAEMSIRQERFADAESWFRKALPLAESDEDRANINQDILVQIQNSFETASGSGDFLTEANERLRLAAEMDPSRRLEILGQKNEAVEAFKKAGAYQQAIDLLMELAASDTELDAIYTRYSQAIDIAESETMMNNPTLAASLEQEFIDAHPGSSYAFFLRLAAISAKAENASRRTEAAEAYLALYEEAHAGSIDTEDVPESSLLADAIRLYNLEGNIPTGYALMNRFIETYPNHSDTVPYMEYMAKGYYDRKENEDYKRMAKAIYAKDPSKNSYYMDVATTELRTIAQEFDAAYLNQDFEGAFAARDRYRSLENAYKKEGLSFPEDIHEIFAAVQREYDKIQERKAFLANYDSRLEALGRSSIFTQSPAQQIRVVAITTWDSNLGGGDNRIKKYMSTIEAEVNKVRTLIRQTAESEIDMDNDRQIKALALIARIYDRGAEVVGTQIETFFRITTQGRYYREQWGENAEAQIQGFKMQNIQEYIINSLTYNNQIYTQFHLAGYQNAITQAAKDALLKYNQSVEYRSQDYVLDNQWQQNLDPAATTVNFSRIQSPKGQSLGRTTIPSNNTLNVTRSFNMDLEPNFAYLHISFPLGIQVKLNGSVVNSSWVVIDTLEAGKPASTLYSFIIPGEMFARGSNVFELSLENSSADEQQAALALQTMTSLQRIRENIPPVVKNIFTNSGWRIITSDPDTGEESSSYAADASEWNITWDNLVNMEPNAARPIWVSELEGPVNDLVFETDFMLDSEFKEGIIEFIAPEAVTVYLNGSEIGSAIFDYDPDPLEIYKGEVLINASHVVNGRNVLRFEVSNSSVYRGFLAKITYSQAGKEEIR
ncbi:MAG: tetratricopeptide repeat protein [Candidatus Cloacimonetes bacterium]|nr:tetratricopeptide repeat protein [Candidatus Cloacimonadota bacterium]